MKSASSSSKPRKKAKTSTSTNNEDKLSELPDTILSQILSLCPTKSAVSTSVLSKRWKFVWISVPNLDFGDNCSHYDRSTLVKQDKFRNFVDRVLHLNIVASVRTVQLILNRLPDALDVNAWIRALAYRDAGEFRLTLPRSCWVRNFGTGSRIFSMPDCFFNKKNLVTLRLGNVVLKIPRKVCFPCLKIIWFDSVQFADDDCMKNLLSGCPVLRELYIERDVGEWDNIQTLYVCSSTLDSLGLTTLFCGKDVGYNVLIDAPNLRSMDISDDVGATYNIINVSSLERAELSIRRDVRVSKDVIDFDKRLFELIDKISHVKQLLLLTDTSLESLSTGNAPLLGIFFNNLINLTLDFYRDASWPLLPHLFISMPILSLCILRLKHSHPTCVWFEPQDVPQCFLCLETMIITSFEECDEEMRLVKYILRNATVLKKLSINSYGLDVATEKRLGKKLQKLRRSSPACLVEYSNLRRSVVPFYCEDDSM